MICNAGVSAMLPLQAGFPAKPPTVRQTVKIHIALSYSSASMAVFNAPLCDAASDLQNEGKYSHLMLAKGTTFA